MKGLNKKIFQSFQPRVSRLFYDYQWNAISSFLNNKDARCGTLLNQNQN